jgi:hypothetical protein
MNLAKWLYRGGHPNWLASVANRCSAAVHILGIALNYLVALEVRGRRSGRTVSCDTVVASKFASKRFPQKGLKAYLKRAPGARPHIAVDAGGGRKLGAQCEGSGRQGCASFRIRARGRAISRIPGCAGVHSRLTRAQKGLETTTTRGRSIQKLTSLVYPLWTSFETEPCRREHRKRSRESDPRTTGRLTLFR